MIIRPEDHEQFPRIYDLVKIAFQTAKVSNGQEQDFVNQLRSSGNYIPELALPGRWDTRSKTFNGSLPQFIASFLL